MSVVTFPPTFRSKWGLYYPCDYQTYRCLRRIRGAFETARKRAAEWNRYHRRAPRNRKTPLPLLVMPFTKFDLETVMKGYYDKETGDLLYERYTFKKAVVPDHVMCRARAMVWGWDREDKVVQLPVTKEEVLALCEELGLPTETGKSKIAN
jgi:hypothetical protein